MIAGEPSLDLGRRASRDEQGLTVEQCRVSAGSERLPVTAGGEVAVERPPRLRVRCVEKQCGAKACLGSSREEFGRS